jgi:phage tail-like protein
MPEPVPFTTFNFQVRIDVEGLPKPLCQAEFSDCDGLDMTMTPKTIREGGSNVRPIQLAGTVAYGQLTLKRGMSKDFGLWRWFDQLRSDRFSRAQAVIGVLSPDRRTVDVKFVLTNCMPVRIKAPALSGKDGAVAIEELQVVYECLALDS